MRRLVAIFPATLLLAAGSVVFGQETQAPPPVADNTQQDAVADNTKDTKKNSKKDSSKDTASAKSDDDNKDNKKKKDKKKDVEAIGDRDVGKGINWISLEKEIATQPGNLCALHVARSAIRRARW